MKKLEAGRLQNIDSVKTTAKTNYHIIRKSTRVNSVLATKRLWIVAALALVQAGILYKNRKAIPQ